MNDSNVFVFFYVRGYIEGLVADNLRLTIELSELQRRYDTERTKFESIQQELQEKIDELEGNLAAAETNQRSAAIEYKGRIDLLEKQNKSNRDFLEVSYTAEYFNGWIHYGAIVEVITNVFPLLYIRTKLQSIKIFLS